MGFFSLVETFFFISLAITFVLIMMIVYHFKERLTTLEQKTSTITDIMNNFLKELTYLKVAISQVAQNSLRNSEIDEERLEERVERQKIIVSDSEEESDEDDSDEDNDSYDDYESDFEEIPVIKHIKIHSTTEGGDISEEFDENLNFEEYANVKENEESQLSESDTLEIQLTDDLIEELSEESKDEIIVKKIESILETQSIPLINKMVNPTEVYRKMEIGELRTLVIQQGLATDTKKLKKMDLIRLLTNSD